MTGIRRDGERVGPFTTDGHGLFPFDAGDKSYTANGNFWSDGCGSPDDMIAAGYPWADLGAKLGDTVRRVWNGTAKRLDDYEFCFEAGFAGDADSLYVIIKRADAPKPAPVCTPCVNPYVPSAKPADRPRAAHKLGLQDGDVVELVGWQREAPNQEFLVGKQYIVGGRAWAFLTQRANRKGHRPLFRVISRAADAKPDEVIVRYASKNGQLWSWNVFTDCDRVTITFPHGSDVGTVTREKL